MYVRRLRTHARMNGRTFETGFIRSTLSKSRPKNQQPTGNDNGSKTYYLTM